MCTYSMVATDWMNPNSPNHIPVPGWIPSLIPPMVPLPIDSSVFTIPTVQSVKEITPDTAKLMLEILEKIDNLDKKMGFLDCKLNELDKKAYVGALCAIAGKGCVCRKKKKAKKKYPKHNASAGGTRGSLGRGKRTLLSE